MIINTLKQTVKQFLIRRNKERWKGGDQEGNRVLIQTNKYLDQNFWTEKFKTFELESGKRYDIVCSKNIYDFLNHIPKAEYCFCFGVSPEMELSQRSLKLIFLGLNSSESLNDLKLPKSIRFASIKGLAAPSIADYTLTFTLLILNRFDELVHLSKQKKWIQAPFLNETRLYINDQVVGILGLGPIGREISKVFYKHTENIYACDINPDYNLGTIKKWFLAADLELFISSINILIIALPLTESTKHIINRSVLEKAKRDLILINIARGKLINENDLFNILKAKQIKAAVLDTTIKEPYPRNGKLRKLKNVIITPHISGNINLFKEEISARFINEIVETEK